LAPITPVVKVVACAAVVGDVEPQRAEELREPGFEVNVRRGAPRRVSSGYGRRAHGRTSLGWWSDPRPLYRPPAAGCIENPGSAAAVVRHSLPRLNLRRQRVAKGTM